jgi:putative ABC transport system permease protein
VSREALRLALAAVRASPRRSAQVVLALGLAAAGALLFHGFCRHTYWGLGESFARAGNGHVQVARAGWFDTATPEGHRVARLELEAVRSAALASEVAGAIEASTLRREVQGLLVHGERSAAFLGTGTEPAAELALAPLLVVASGRVLLPEDGRAMLLGSGLSERLHAGPGDTVTALVQSDGGDANAADFEVVGIVQGGMEELDRAHAILPLDAALALVDGVDVDALVLGLRDTSDTDRVAAAVADLAASSDLSCRPWHTRAHYYLAVRALYDRIFGVFQALVAVVTILSLTQAVSAVVGERRQEIALLRTIGLTRTQVTATFLVEGALLGAGGAVTGILLAVLAAAITRAVGGIPMPPPPGFTIGYAAQFQVGMSSVAIVAPVTVLCAVVAAVRPAWRAAGAPVARALAGLAVLGLVLPPAHAQDAPVDVLAGADVAFAIPEGQVCTTDLRVSERSREVRWRVQRIATEALVARNSPARGLRQYLLLRAADTWMQTATMAAPLRIDTTPSMGGWFAIGDLLLPRWKLDWVPGTGETGSLDAIALRAREGGRAATPRASLSVDARGAPRRAQFVGASGAVVRQAEWTWEGGAPVRLDVTDAIRAVAVHVEIGAPRCAEGGAAIPEGGILAAGEALVGQGP